MQISSSQKGLVGHWPLAPDHYNAGTKRVSDLSACRNHGTSANAAVAVADRMGQLRAMQFNGTSDYVNMGDILEMGTIDFTISVWIKINIHKYFNSIVGRGWLGDPLAGYGIHGASDGYVSFQLRSLVSTNTISSNNVLQTGTWYHLIAERQYGVTSSLYINNVLQNDTMSESYDLTQTNDFRIGCNSQTAFPLAGCVSDCRVYNRLLTDNEKTLLYESYNPRIAIGSLCKDLVLDMPLHTPHTQSSTPGSEIMSDRSAYRNHGQNNGGDIDSDHHTTFVAANSDYVRIPDNNSLDNSPYLSVVCWVKGAGQLGRAIVSKYDYGADKRSWALLASSVSPFQKLRVIISDDGTYSPDHSKVYRSSIDILDNTWHLAGFTFDAGTLKLYVDGVEDINPTKSMDAAITTIFPTDIDVMVASYLASGSPASFFDGDIAKARIYNRVLTAAEWKLYYDQTSGLYV